MEESRRGKSAYDEENTQTIATIIPVSPGQKKSRSSESASDKTWELPAASVELTIMLKQIETYFGKQSQVDDLEALSFSLRHLFHRIDFLYRHALPEMNNCLVQKQEEDYNKEILQRQRIWLRIQAINRTLDRMAPLCHLLSDTIECLLDTLDDEDMWLRTLDDEDTIQLEQIKVEHIIEAKSGATRQQESQPKQTISTERWEQVINAIMDQLLLWQECHHKLTSFPQQFAQALPMESNLNDLDPAFAMLLDSAGAIFGDILPNFRLVKPDDREEIGALLFDLMQQSDQMLAQFEVTLGPFTRLSRHFAITGEST